MSLAAEYLTQAALEQYLVYGAKGPDALREAFAWGFNSQLGGSADTDDGRVNAMFFGDGKDVIREWEEIRQRSFREVISPHYPHLLSWDPC